MTTQKIEPCEFVAGLCSNCGAAEQLDCEGWVAPDVMLAMLVKERDALTRANKDLIDWFDALKADHDKLKAAGKLALEAMHNHEGNYKLNDAGCDRQNAAITSLMESGVS